MSDLPEPIATPPRPWTELDPSLGHNPNCIVCGESNPASMAFRNLERSADELRALVTFTAAHEGDHRRVHGGIIATAMDEAFGRLAFTVFRAACLTARLEVDYEGSAVAPGDYELRVAVDRREGRKLWLQGQLGVDPRLARARALFIEISSPGRT
ncbi:MAG: PaaI family thioesterase [Solirubrobacterales bacterium]